MGDATGLIDPQAAVDQLFGKGRAQVVEATTSTKVTETEVILINGSPVQLIGKDGESLREALLAGKLPDQGLLSRILASVLGNELRGVTKVESEVNVTSRVTSRDSLSVLRDGKVIDRRTKEWQSDSESYGKCSEKFSPSISSFSTSPSPIFTSSGSSSRTTPSPSPGNFQTSSSSSSNPQTPSANLSRSSSSNRSSSLNRTHQQDFKPSTSLTRGLSLKLKPYHESNIVNGTTGPCVNGTAGPYINGTPGPYVNGTGSPLIRGTLRTKDGPCLSPELEESLARTSVKDHSGYRRGQYSNYSNKPTIFGTVADDHTPRDNVKRGFPQTPKSGKPCSLSSIDVSGSPPEWALIADDDNSLVYEDGVLISGSLQALVQHATPTTIYYPDTAYLFAFLLSARLFIKPHDLLQKICDLGFAQQGLKGSDLSTINKDQLGNFIPHMVQLLGEWSETFPYDFRDERMMVGVRTLTHRCIALQPLLRRDVTQVLHNLLNKLTNLERYEENLAKLTVPPPSDTLVQVVDIADVCPSALVMAQQLTHIELERLSYIGPEEFVQAFAKDNLEATYKDLKKTNNLESYVQWFNRLSFLVATQACSPVKKKQRVRVIEYWIEVARECFNIGNFNSLMGVIAGLNMSPVSRLKKTWSKVQSAKFSVLEHQMDPSSNFSSYRSTLKAAMWRSAGAVDERQKIVIPFFSLLVKDLYFLNEGCANRLPNGHINFDKFWQLAKQVTEFMAWKQVSCPFEKGPDVLRFLQTTPVLSETGLALASFEGEGPENSYEKERYKNIK